jgi:lipid II:glycine glycyltransferase (peptidoglycan interpeptide bridge formation enzyme)
MFKYLKAKQVKKVDLLWVAPEWIENHHLLWVSQFKHSLWWKHIEYFWNYDLPLNNLVYKFLKKIKK